MNAINQRLIFILNKMFNGNVSEFSRASGIPQPTLNNIVGNRMSKPSADNLERLVNSIEIINSDWLLTGKGDMLKKQQVGDVSNNSGNVAVINENNGHVNYHEPKKEQDAASLMSEYMGRLKERDEQVSMLISQNTKLIEQIDKLK